jgi:phosphoinositide-3-kinase regulatory subunit 4
LNDEYCSILHHYDAEFSSLLLFASNKGNTMAVDLRSMDSVWKFSPSPHWGNVTSLTIDKHRNWALMGTHRGVLCLFDTRFQVPLSIWQHPSKGKICQLSPYTLLPQGKPTANTAKSVCMSVQNKVNEISVWDVDSLECHQIWCSIRDELNDSSTDLDKYYGNGVSVTHF